jgi:hypothetical protein
MQRRKTVLLTLHDGETVKIAAHDVPRVCENLLSLAPNADAMIVAGAVVAISRECCGDVPLELTPAQTGLIRKAVAQPEAA